MINKSAKIYVAGHNGMVGRAIVKSLYNCGYKNIIGKNSNELDLRNQKEVFDFIKYENPSVVIDAAARVGGIKANNNFPYQFIMDNILIQNNLIDASHKNDIKKFIFLGSSCIYPKKSNQPIKEEYLLTGSLEKTNEWYAIAKISGIKIIESLRKQYDRDYLALMPTNLYGPHDNFDLETSHVLPAIIRKIYDAKIKNKKTLKLWGSGKPLREFMHVDDLATAVIFAIEKNLKHHLYNVGSGSDISISDLAKNIKNLIDYNGEILWDESQPDGTYRKLMDSSKLRKEGWEPKIDLNSGIYNTIKWYTDNKNNIREVKIK